MPDRIASPQDELARRLRFYADIGIDLFYMSRTASSSVIPSEASDPAQSVAPTYRPSSPNSTFAAGAASITNRSTEEPTLPKSARPQTPSLSNPKITPAPAKIDLLPLAPKVSLFDSVSRVADDSLPKILAEIGDNCTRCKLHKGRTKLVFGDGNPKAELVFVGEGPGRDEDLQGLPFVGRAGKLLNQMIEAMGLQRKDVYICNVVKCRPPENRAPEPDEVKSCSPFLLRQLDVIAPKVIVCLGSVASQTLLQTNRGISGFRGEWLEFRGYRLMATYHPAYLLRNPAAKADVWKDLQKVMAVLGLQVKKTKPAEPGRPS
jgi:uracil-DNA glycosylase family 4